MGDMTAILAPKSDQINADDLIGRTITITVKSVAIKGGQEQPISIHFAESDKVFRPCKSMCRVLAHAWGLDSKDYVGKSMTLYCDPSVKFGPLAVGGIRISHMSHIDGEMQMALTATKGVKKAYKVKPLVVERTASAGTGITIEAALADMETANDLDELKAIWMRKAMAPHRTDLQADLDRIKKRLADPTEGPATEQRGDGFDGWSPDDMIAQIDMIDDADMIDALMTTKAATVDAYEAADQFRVRNAAKARKVELK